VDQTGNHWDVFYNVSYAATVTDNGLVAGSGHDVALESDPEASTFVMLAGAALTGLGYAGLRWFRKPKATKANGPNATA
jgi:hypothetical protein